MAESNITTKVCLACGETKLLDCFHLNPRNKKDGRHSWCKPCKKVYYQNKWAEAGPEVRVKSAEKARARMHADPEAHRTRSLAWKDRNREKVNARAQELHKLYPEREALRRSRYDIQARRNATARYRVNHPDRVKTYRIKYRAENLDKYAVWARNRRAIQRKAGGKHTAADIDRLFVLQKRKCAACRKPLRKRHVDHVISLARGGSNGPENLQLLCPPCNHRKHAKHPVDFMRELGFLL